MMKKRITAILAAAIIAVGASVPAFADSDFNTVIQMRKRQVRQQLLSGR